MEDNRRDTVVVEKERDSNPLGWIIGLIIAILLIAAFFYFGGFGLFGGGSTNEGGSVNVTVPDTVQVQPTTGQ
jgi:hypothetical protein